MRRRLGRTFRLILLLIFLILIIPAYFITRLDSIVNEPRIMQHTNEIQQVMIFFKVMCFGSILYHLAK